MDPRLITALEAVVGVPLVLVGYITATEFLVRMARGKWRERIRPWLWLTPALVILTAFLIAPTIQTIWMSLHNKNGSVWLGLDNYAWFMNGTARTGGAALETVANINWRIAGIADYHRSLPIEIGITFAAARPQDAIDVELLPAHRAAKGICEVMPLSIG